MNLREFYQSIRELEETIATPLTVIVSRATADGGKAGILSEVPRNMAARLVVEGKATLATADEAEAFLHARKETAAQTARESLAKRLGLLSAADIDAIRELLESPKA